MNRWCVVRCRDLVQAFQRLARIPPRLDVSIHRFTPTVHTIEQGVTASGIGLDCYEAQAAAGDQPLLQARLAVHREAAAVDPFQFQADEEFVALLCRSADIGMAERDPHGHAVFSFPRLGDSLSDRYPSLQGCVIANVMQLNS